MGCKRCGNCCREAVLTISHLIVNGKILNLDQLARWLSYHRCDAKRVGELSDLLEVKIPLSCIHLGFNEVEGTYFCKIYNKRPEICRVFLCERAKESE